MKTRRRAPWALEALEDRSCPSVNVTYSAGSLSISGTPNAALKLTGLGGSNFRLTDGAVTYGNFSSISGNVTMTLAREPSDVEVDLRGSTIGGNLTIDLGLGYSGPASSSVSVDVFDSLATTALGAGTVRGSVFIRNGNGREIMDVGGQVDTNSMYTNLPVTVRGDLSVTARINTLGFDRLQVGRGTNVRGRLILAEVDDVTVGDQNSTISTPTRVSGTVSVTTSQASLGTSVVLRGQFGSSVTVRALAPTPNFNSFTLEPEDQGTNTVVAGTLDVTLGSAILGNVFTIQNGASGETTEVDGNTTLTSTSGSITPSDDFFIQGNFFGVPGSNNLTVNAGVGNNSVTIDAAAVGLGNVAIRADNGDNTVTVNGSVNGDLRVTLGNGDNQASVSQTVGGAIWWTSGSGNDSLTITADGVTLLNADFGAGDDFFDYSPATGGAIGCPIVPSPTPHPGLIDGGPGFDVHVEGPNATHLASYAIANFEV